MKSLIPDSLRLVVVGVNHRTAPVELRESIAFTPDAASDAINLLREKFPGSEVVILSTCNRVELYFVRPVGGQPSIAEITLFLSDFHKLAPDQLTPHVYHREDRAVIEHLFAVASSLDSMVVGETQILAQVKAAYQHASAAGSAGKVLHALFQRAFAAAKDVHEKTNLSAGRLSVASVAIDLARSVFDRFDDKTVLCVGAGKMASLMLRHLVDLKPGKLLITNRTFENAQAAAATFHGEARPLEQLDQLLTEADILLTSTGASQPVITEARFKALLKARRYRPIVIIDIAVPRDVETAVGTLRNVYLYNVDDLQEVAAGNKEKRDEKITASRAVLADHVEEFLKWFAARDVGPIVKALYERCNQIAAAELEAIYARTPDMTPEQKAELARLTHRLVGKILHDPVTQLTARAEHTARPMLATALKKLFSLDKDASDSHE